jgi:hypothetical protein
MANPIQFKPTPHAPWQDWMYLGPTPQTLAVLKRESEANQRKMIRFHLSLKKKGILKPLPSPFALFYGQKVYAFKWKDEEWNVEKGASNA